LQFGPEELELMDAVLFHEVVFLQLPILNFQLNLRFVAGLGRVLGWIVDAKPMNTVGSSKIYESLAIPWWCVGVWAVCLGCGNVLADFSCAFELVELY
jgi:hypothetical protein